MDNKNSKKPKAPNPETIANVTAKLEQKRKQEEEQKIIDALYRNMCVEFATTAVNGHIYRGYGPDTMPLAEIAFVARETAGILAQCMFLLSDKELIERMDHERKMLGGAPVVPSDGEISGDESPSPTTTAEDKGDSAEG